MQKLKTYHGLLDLVVDSRCAIAGYTENKKRSSVIISPKNKSFCATANYVKDMYHTLIISGNENIAITSIRPARAKQ